MAYSDYESKSKRIKLSYLEDEKTNLSNFKYYDSSSNGDYSPSFSNNSMSVQLNGKLINDESNFKNLSIQSLNNLESINLENKLNEKNGFIKKPATVYKLFKRIKIRKDILKGLKSMNVKENHDKSIEQHKLIYKFLTEHQDYNIFIRSKPFHKIIAYLIHLLQQIDTDLNQIQVLIIPCTLELSNYIYEIAIKLLKYNDKIKIRMLKSDCSIESRIKDHFVISTTGSVTHTLKSFKQLIDLSYLKFLVFEEFDLVNSSKDNSKFRNTESLENIINKTNSKCKQLFFSTCFEDNGLFSAREFTNDNLVILNLLKSNRNHFEKTLHFYVNYSNKNKLELLLNIIRYSVSKKIVIFVCGKYAPSLLYNLLCEKGVRSIMLTNDLRNDLRIKAVNDFQANKERILIVNYPLNVSIDFGSEVELMISYDPVTRGERYLYREFFQKFSYLDKYDKLAFGITFMPSNLLGHIDQLKSYFDIDMFELKPYNN